MSTISQDSTQDSLIAAFTPPSLNGSSVGIATRQAATAAIAHLSLPTLKTEQWRYTNIRPLLKHAYLLSQKAAVPAINIADYMPEGWMGAVIVFYNGFFSASLSHIPEDVRPYIHSLNGLQGAAQTAFEAHFGKLVAAEKSIFSALNTAYAKEGVFVHIPAKQAVATPICLLHLTDAQMDMALQLRNLVVVEAHAEAKFVELYRTVGESPAHTLRNAVMEIFVGESASVEYVKIQEESDRNSHIERTEISQAANSRVSTHCFTFSGEIVRNELIFHLNGSHIETYLRGAYLLNEKQTTDNYTEVHHKQPHCYSNELYKGVLNDRSRGVFNGLIHVYRDAQKTNAFQSNRNLLLSDSATMKTKPQLEIYADDVKCSHGAATGQIDADALFYMKARGIHEAAAKQLLVQAFAGEVADTVVSDALREYVQHRIATKY